MHGQYLLALGHGPNAEHHGEDGRDGERDLHNLGRHAAGEIEDNIICGDGPGENLGQSPEHLAQEEHHDKDDKNAEEGLYIFCNEIAVEYFHP